MENSIDFLLIEKIRENLKLDGEVLIGGVVDVILLWRDIDYG